MSEADALVNIDTTAIRAAMDHGVIHAFQQVLIDGLAIKVIYSADTAHVFFS